VLFGILAQNQLSIIRVGDAVKVEHNPVYDHLPPGDLTANPGHSLDDALGLVLVHCHVSRHQRLFYIAPELLLLGRQDGFEVANQRLIAAESERVGLAPLGTQSDAGGSALPYPVKVEIVAFAREVFGDSQRAVLDVNVHAPLLGGG